MLIKQENWPHYDKRDPQKPICFLIVHCFALPIAKNFKLWNQLGVGAHYVIDQNGNVTQLVSENNVAWHAGKSFWGGMSALNATSIGIELYSPSLGQKPYPKAQMDAFVKLATQIIKKYHIRPENVVGHSDVAPTRKVDPGKAFPWEEMAKYGVGVWPNACGKITSRKKTKTLLKEIGYDVSNEKAALLAFMRHFMPERVQEEGDVFKMEDDLSSKILALPDPDKSILMRLHDVALAYDQARSADLATGKADK